MGARLLFACVVLAAVPALAFELKTDSTGASIHWPGRADFVVDNRADKALAERRAFAAIQAAADTLGRAVPGLAITLRAGPTTGVGYDFGNGAANQSEIVVITQAWPFDTTALGVTVVTVNTKTHEILDADIALNADQHEFTVIGGNGGDSDGEHDDIQNTVTHELGHALGLAHNPADPESMMFPMAFSGEIKKRVPTPDDEAGLASVYPVTAAATATGSPAPSTDPQVGCSSGAGALAAWLVVLMAPLLFRRRAARAFAILGLAALSLPGLAQASTPARGEAKTREAAVVATAEVVSRRPVPLKPGQRLLTTEVELAVRSCLKGVCPERLVVRVPGGVVGDIEQLVDGMPLPAQGELVGVTVPPEAVGAPPARKAAVYRLGEVRDFVAFAKGLSTAGLAAKLPLPGSAQPPRSLRTLGPRP